MLNEQKSTNLNLSQKYSPPVTIIYYILVSDSPGPGVVAGLRVGLVMFTALVTAVITVVVMGKRLDHTCQLQMWLNHKCLLKLSKMKIRFRHPVIVSRFVLRSMMIPVLAGGRCPFL